MLFMTGAMIMASARRFGGLLMGRLITGFGVGTGLAIDPLYISEISPPMYRGALVRCGLTGQVVFDPWGLGSFACHWLTGSSPFPPLPPTLTT